MSPRHPPATSGKRVPYRAPRDRIEVWTAVGVAIVIVVATATLVWFLRPNRGSSGSGQTPATTAATAAPTATTAAPTDTTAAPASTTAPTDTTAAPSGG